MKALYEKFMVLVDWVTGAMVISLVILFAFYMCYELWQLFLDLIVRF